MTDKEETRQNVIKWIEALRNGGYQQCQGFLHKGEAYCCLGVGVECLYGPDVWEAVMGKDREVYAYDDRRMYTILREDDRDKLGVSYLDQFCLMDKNDRGVPFPEIADWLKDIVLSKLEE